MKIDYKNNIIEYQDIRITIITDCLFRLEKKFFTNLKSQSVINRKTEHVIFSVELSDIEITVTTKMVNLIVNIDNIYNSFCIIKNKKVPIKNSGNLKGTLRTLDVWQGHLTVDENITIFDKNHIPLGDGVISVDGVAFLDDSKSLLIDEEDNLVKRIDDSKDIYVFAHNKNYYQALKDFYFITGYPPIVPRWALGNWWSRYYPYTDQSYIKVLDTFEEKNIPLSVAVIDMDWHYVDIDREFNLKEKGLDKAKYGGLSGWTGYSFNKHLFPDWIKFISEIKKRNLKTSLNLHPSEGVRWFEDSYEEFAKSQGVEPKSKKVVEFDFASKKFINNYFKYVLNPYEEKGVDFWWIDWQQGTTSKQEGLDPLWALNHNHYNNINRNKNNSIILSRYAGVGSHRYPLGFSGDTYMSYEFLDYLPYFTSTATNIGYTWWSHDIGGHYGGVRDDELYLRFLQFGVFSPINRLHGYNEVTANKEPWTLYSGYKEVAYKWLRLRHKLIPYIFTYSILTKEKAIPLIVPLYYKYPNQKEAYNFDNEYFFGDSIIINPITKKSKTLGLSEIKTYIPKGRWTDFFSGRTYNGSKTVNMIRDVGSMPVLIKEGTVLPLSKYFSNDTSNPKDLELHIFSGDGSFNLLEEMNNVVYETKYLVKETNQEVIFEINPTVKSALDIRNYSLYFRNIKEGSVKVYKNNYNFKPIIKNSYCLKIIIDNLKHTDFIRVVIKPKKKNLLDCIKDDLLDIIIRQNMGTDFKSEAFKKINDAMSVFEIKKEIKNSKLDLIHKKELLEIL